MHSFSLTKTLAALSCSLALVACGPPDEASRANTGPVVGPFVVSQHFTPSGLMGDGETPGQLTVEVNKHCRPRPIGAQGDCYHFIYRPAEIKWAGAFWVYPSNNWGTVPGRDLIGPLDLGPDPQGVPLRGYNKIRFSAAIDPLPVPPIFSYFAGGIDGSAATPPQPYADKGCQVYPADPSTGTERSVFCDQAFKIVTSDVLGPEWKVYELTINQWGISSVIGGFGWALNETENPGQTVSIYIDDIVWE